MTVLRLTHEPLKITNSNTALLTSEPGVVLNTLISHKTNTTTKSNSNRDKVTLRKMMHVNILHIIRELKKKLKTVEVVQN